MECQADAGFSITFASVCDQFYVAQAFMPGTTEVQIPMAARFSGLLSMTLAFTRVANRRDLIRIIVCGASRG
jgi:hypothetical protein